MHIDSLSVIIANRKSQM